MKKIIFLVFAIMLLFSLRCHAATLYVLKDGADYPTCNGTANVPYSAAAAPNCALSHPAWLTGAGNGTSWTSGRMSANDIGVVGPGEYLMGYTMPNTGGYCTSSNTGDCRIKAPPSGTGGNYTKLIGCSTTGCASEQDRPELYLVGKAWSMMTLTTSSYVEISDFEITDHDSGYCDAGVPLQLCGGRAFYSPGTGATWHHIKLTNLNIHGLAETGINMGSSDAVSDVAFTLTNVDIRANRVDGFSSDTCSSAGTCGYEGTITFDGGSVEFNGCYENYPLTGVGDDLVDGYCRNQDDDGGVNGDGISAGSTGGIWIFNNVNSSHNPGEGIDMLYHCQGCGINACSAPRDYNCTAAGADITVNGGIFEGNGGNQLKLNRTARIYSALVLGNCNYFYPGVNPDGSPNGDNSNNPCRAGGDAIVLSSKNGVYDEYPGLFNSTVTGVGVSLVYSGVAVDAHNNIFYGGAQFRSDPDYYPGQVQNYTSLTYLTNLYSGSDYNICHSFNSYPSICSANNNITDDPEFTGTVYSGPDDYYWTNDFKDQLLIGETSPARNMADETAQTDWHYDVNEVDRDPAWDVGAYEYNSSITPLSCDDSCDSCADEAACDASTYPCYWWDSDSDCHSVEETCNNNCALCAATQAACEASLKPCYWWDSTSSCESVSEGCNDDCDDCSNEVACEASTLGTCEWWRSTGDCGITTEACSDHYTRCLTEGTCEAASFYWYEERCNVNPEGSYVGVAKDTVVSSQMASTSTVTIPITVGTNYPPGRVLLVSAGWETAGTTPTDINSVMAGDIECHQLRSKGFGTASLIDEDMEDQSYSLTSTVVWGTNEIQTDNAFSGAYSSEHYAPAGGSAYLRSTAVAGQSTIYSKFRVFLPLDYAADGIDIFRARDPYPATLYLLSLDVNRLLNVYNSPNATTYPTTATIPLGEYTDIVSAAYIHDTAGWIKVWVNGSLVLNQTAIDTRKTVSYSTYGTVDFGITVNDDVDTAATIYTDNIEAGTAVDQGNYLAMYYCYPDTGTINVTTTWGAAAAGVNVGIVSLAGVNQSVVPVGTVEEGASATASDTITTTADDSWVVDAVATTGTNDFTPASGQTGQYTTTQSMTMEGSIRETTTAGEQVMSWGLTSANWGIITAIVQPSIEYVPEQTCPEVCTECTTEEDCTEGCYWWTTSECKPSPQTFITGCSFTGVKVQ